MRIKNRPSPEYILRPQEGWLRKVYQVIYFADTKAGKTFDIALLVVILLSTAIVIIETIPGLNPKTIEVLYNAEFFITILFTIEYILRLLSIKNKRKYIFSFNGVIDVLSILPFYISMIFPSTHYLVVIRLLRLLRVFRIFNLLDYMNDGKYIIAALKNSYRKIYIFLLFMSIFIVIIGAIMYMVEGGKNGFTSISACIYWAVVTITTVGYGDISPVTPLGQFLAIIVMLCGYSIIAVPTGIVTSEFKYNIVSNSDSDIDCVRCGNTENHNDARFCKICGERLPS